MNITVYLGANEGNDQKLGTAVQELGQWIGVSGNALIYGGSKTGLTCILYNLDGYYNSLKELLVHMIEKGLSSKERQQGIYFAENLDQIKQIIKAYHIAKDVSKKLCR